MSTVNSLSCAKLCDRARYPAVCNHQKTGTLWSERDGHGQLQYSGKL